SGALQQCPPPAPPQPRGPEGQDQLLANGLAEELVGRILEEEEGPGGSVEAATRWAFQPGQNPGQGALAGTVLPRQEDELPRPDLQVNLPQEHPPGGTPHPRGAGGDGPALQAEEEASPGSLAGRGGQQGRWAAPPMPSRSGAP